MTHRGYIGQVFEVRPVLAAMEDRGVPIDDEARVRLDREFEVAQSALGEEIAKLAPAECGRVHPKEGYKGIPPEVKQFIVDNHLPPLESVYNETASRIIGARFREGDGESYFYALREFSIPDDDLKLISTVRWCRVYDFNPNSSQQLLSYMRQKKHKVPKSRKNEDAEGNAKDTTEKKELVRLAHKTGDTFYLKVIEFREFSKMRGTYIEGFKPGPDGRVHATFTFDTGTGQLAARNPNVTNFPKRMRLAKRLRRMVMAPDGKILVEFDYKSYHVVTTGFCAEDASYIRLAKLDMHSFVAWHLLKLPGADELAGLDDAELAEKLAWFKSDEKRKWVRDNQAKPSILGIGFGMGYRRLYQENIEYFAGEREAKRLHDLLKALFPKVFAWQDRIKRKAHEDQKLVSPFGHIRRFYEVVRWDGKRGDWAPGDQAEEAVAFLPANIAFGNIRETMKQLAWWKYDGLYGLCNNVHDSFLFCFPEPWLERCVRDVMPVLEAPSKVLKHPTIAPEGLVIGVEGSWGRSWDDMREIKVRA